MTAVIERCWVQRAVPGCLVRARGRDAILAIRGRGALWSPPGRVSRRPRADARRRASRARSVGWLPARPPCTTRLTVSRRTFALTALTGVTAGSRQVWRQSFGSADKRHLREPLASSPLQLSAPGRVYCFLTSPVPEWRNWQTRGTQNPVPFTGSVGSIPSSGTK